MTRERRKSPKIPKSEKNAARLIRAAPFFYTPGFIARAPGTFARFTFLCRFPLDRSNAQDGCRAHELHNILMAGPELAGARTVPARSAFAGRDSIEFSIGTPLPFAANRDGSRSTPANGVTTSLS